VDGKVGFAANPNTIGMTIADQLVASSRTCKSYQENLPPTGTESVNNADGFFSNLDNLITDLPGEGQTQSNLVDLYAVKHNPLFPERAGRLQSAAQPEENGRLRRHGAVSLPI